MALKKKKKKNIKFYLDVIHIFIKLRYFPSFIPVKFTESVEVLFEVKSSVLGSSTGAEATSSKELN